jgi:hypothetical protein
LVVVAIPTQFIRPTLTEMKAIVDRALASLSPVFNRMYSKRGRPSIPPEHLLNIEIARRAPALIVAAE